MTLEEELRSLSQGMMEADEGVMTPSDQAREFISREIENVRSSL